MSAIEDLVAVLERMGGREVLCIGDVMLDRYVHGQVDRISPEAPIPVMRVESEQAMLGGAGNVARNLTALGAKVHFVGVVGDDDAGRLVLGRVGDEAAIVPDLVVERGRKTTVKTRFVVRGQQMLRADSETTEPVAGPTLARLVAAAEEAARSAAAVVISDYGKGVLAPAVVAAAVAAGRKAGVPVIVDPKGNDFGRYRGASVVTPNRRELAEASGMQVGDDAAIVAAARHVIASAGVGAILATRSEQGMTLVLPKAVHHFPAEAREVYDVSGAGDTAVAVLATALAAGAALPEAAKLANVAAGIVVGKAGTATVGADEVEDALLRADVLALTDQKVGTRETAARRVRGWREMGLRVGFTNGCFDLLHPGHISLLAQARAACDRLVVGLNDDASVRRLKGDSRPVQSEWARAIVLASLATVDLVVLFAEDTPLALIETIQPDVLVKGADYTIETVVGADLVQAYGGRILLADLTPGFSTTGTLARIRR